MGAEEVSWERLRSISTIDQFMHQCTAEERIVTSELRNLILECGDFREKITYGVPFFYRNRRVVFIWPASAAFGPKRGVQLGFCYGYLMRDTARVLDRGNRKQVYWILLRGNHVDNHSLLRDYILEAMEVDDGFRTRVRH